MSSNVIKESKTVYFLTSTVVGWVDLFTRQVYRVCILDSWKYCILKKQLHLHAFVVMSSHLHWIASSEEDQKLDAIVRDFKKFTSKQMISMIQQNEKESRKQWLLNLFGYAGKNNADNKDYKVWQTGNHAEYLYSDKFKEQKLNYIHNNPVRAGIVEKPEDYLYSSARNYMGEKGLIEIEPLIICYEI